MLTDEMKLTYSALHSICKRYKRYWREYLGEAWVIMHDAVETHDPERGTLPKRVSALVRGRLMDILNKENYIRHKEVSAEYPPTEDEVTEEFSEDVRTVLSLLEEFPRAPTRNRLMIALRDLGWTGARIIESFDEIREYLS